MGVAKPPGPAMMLTWLVERMIPSQEREIVLGDLLEEGVPAGSWRYVRLAMGIGLWWQAHPFGSPSGRRGVLLSLAAGLGLLLGVTWATSASAPPLDLFRDPVSRGALMFWATPHLTAAIAAGLVVGHAPWTPSMGRAQLHVGLVLVLIAAGLAPTGRAGVLSGLVLALAMMVGARGRTPARDPGPRLSGPPVSRGLGRS